VKLTWLGHATARIEVDDVVVLTDPLLVDNLSFLRRVVPLPASDAWREVDVVLISHLHRDHFDFRSLRMVGRGFTLVVPPGAGRLARKVGVRDVRELAAGETTVCSGLRLEATPAHHNAFRVPFGPISSSVGYLVHGDKRVYFAGDTSKFAGMAAIGPVDVALLSVGGWGPTLRGGHLDPRTAAEALTLLRPKVAVPLHYGTFWPAGVRWRRRSRLVEPGEEFVRQAARVAPAVRVIRADIGRALCL
jgi:L-ascorbate metabolism protein UlaG (beta-lactamase superfamily)